MGSRFVTLTGTFTGIITEADPNAPHPSHPISLPGDPGWGMIPGFSGPGGGIPIWPGHPDYPTRPQPQPPLGIWGPTDPRPNPPIYWPGYPTQPPPWWGSGQPPITPPSGPAIPGQLPASDPTGSGWVYCYVPGYGWMWAQVPQKPTEPPVEPV